MAKTKKPKNILEIIEKYIFIRQPENKQTLDLLKDATSLEEVATTIAKSTILISNSLWKTMENEINEFVESKKKKAKKEQKDKQAADTKDEE